MSMRVTAMRATAICAAALLTACSAHQQKQAQDTVNAAALAGAVHAKLATIDADSLTAVKVETNGGIVTLSGEVRSPQERAAYDSAAATVNGVTRVVDRLTVNPAVRGPRESLGDAALAAKVTANITAQAGINAARIKPSVRDGIVTLSGTVPSAALKSTVLETARKTSGVKGVVDRIEVKS